MDTIDNTCFSYKRTQCDTELVHKQCHTETETDQYRIDRLVVDDDAGWHRREIDVHVHNIMHTDLRQQLQLLQLQLPSYVHHEYMFQVRQVCIQNKHNSCEPVSRTYTRLNGACNTKVLRYK